MMEEMMPRNFMLDPSSVPGGICKPIHAWYWPVEIVHDLDQDGFYG